MGSAGISSRLENNFTAIPGTEAWLSYRDASNNLWAGDFKGNIRITVNTPAPSGWGNTYTRAVIQNGLIDNLPNSPFTFNNYATAFGIRLDDVADNGSALTAYSKIDNVSRAALVVKNENRCGSLSNCGYENIGVYGAALGNRESRGVGAVLQNSNFNNLASVSLAYRDSSNRLWGGYFAGDVYIGRFPGLSTGGNVYAYNYFYNSDLALKKNLIRINDSLKKIESLNGYYFNWKDGNQPAVGLVAQEVQKVFPMSVSKSGEYLSVDYSTLIAPLVEAIKELSNKNDQIEAQNNRQQEEINRLNEKMNLFEQEIENLRAMIK